jgi:hypothetical protein
MADIVVNPSASYTVAADVIGNIGYQRVKVQVGADGTVGDVDATNPLPVVGTVAVSGAVGVSGAVSISAMPAVSGTVTVNGSVAVVPGVSVVAQVSGTVTIAPTTFTVNTVAAGASVNALVTGAVSISAMPAVSITVSAVLGTIVTQLGTQMVSIAQTSVSIAALPTVNTIVTILGTHMVSVVPGLSVSAVVSGTVSISGTVIVNDALIMYTTAAPSVSATGQVVWNVGMAITTAAPGAAQTGQVVWVANPASVTVTVTNTGQMGTGIAFYYSSVSAQTIFTQGLMAVAMLGTSVQTSNYVVPANRVLSLNGIFLRVQNTAASVAFYQALVQVRASLSVSTTVGPIYAVGGVAVITSATNAVMMDMIPIRVDLTGGMTVQFDFKVTGAAGGIIEGMVMGNLF